MLKYSIATGTVTNAIRGRDILRNSGIKAHIERSLSPQRIGCGYSVMAYGNPQKAEELLRKNGIKIYEIKTVTE